MTGSGHPCERGGRLESLNPGVMETRTDFETAWRVEYPKLRRMFRARGIPDAVIDDVMQETAVKLLRTWDRVDPARPLTPLVRTVANNCLVDIYRAQRAVPVEEVPDSASTYDLEAHALARARWSKVTSLISDLGTRDQAILLGEIDAGRRGNDSATKMARMRARARLTAALERTGTAFGAAQLSFRKTLGWFQSIGAEAHTAATTAVGVATAVTVGLATMSPTPAIAVKEPAVVAQHEAAVDHSTAPRPAPKKRSPSREKQPELSPQSSENVSLSAPSADEPEPDAAREQEKTEAAGTEAKTGSYQGVRYATVCTGDETSSEADDQEVSVAYNDGTQNGSNGDEDC